MRRDATRETVRRLIHGITRISLERIVDDASFRETLSIDSLSLIEIGIAVDYEFRLNLPEESFRPIDTLAQAVELVESELALRESAARAG